MRLNPEEEIQRTICRWLDARGMFYHSVPNEANGRGKIAQLRLMQIGLRPGVADLVVWMGDGRVAYMEVKSKTGRQSQAQKAFEAICMVNGIPYRLVRSLEDAKKYIMDLEEESR